MSIIELLASPAAWAALLTLIVMEVVLGIDNLVFVAILSNKLPEADRARTRRIGIGLALILRLLLLTTISWIVGMTAPVIDFGWSGAPDLHGNPAGWSLARPPLHLETTIPGIFAVGDVRCGSAKRVAAAVGEGSVCVQLIHRLLSE